MNFEFFWKFNIFFGLALVNARFFSKRYTMYEFIKVTSVLYFTCVDPLGQFFRNNLLKNTKK